MRSSFSLSSRNQAPDLPLTQVGRPSRFWRGTEIDPRENGGGGVRYTPEGPQIHFSDNHILSCSVSSPSLLYPDRADNRAICRGIHCLSRS